jgi:nitroreductase
MRPRRDVFATDFIETAVDAYKNGLPTLNDGEKRWANDVFDQYFSTVSTHPAIDRARREFLSCAAKVHTDSPPHVPNPRYQTRTAAVAFEELMALSIQRRSVRWYQQRPVPRDLVDQALQVAALAPSACNRQPFEYRIFDDPALLSVVAGLPPGIVGYSDNIPMIGVLVGKLRAYPNPRDRHVIYIDGGLSAMAFMYALETVGLSSCPINWPDVFNLEAAMARILNLATDERVIMLISIGYPDPNGLVPSSRKLSLSTLRNYNRISRDSTGI